MKKFFYFLFVLLFLFSFSKATAEEAKTVVINELMWMGSSKSSADEWIELKNLTDENTDLSGWKIKGAATNDGDLVIPDGKIIKAFGYFLISNYEKDSDKTIIDSETFDNLGEESYWVTPSTPSSSSISLSNSEPKYFLETKGGLIIDEVDKDAGVPLAGNNEKKYSMERVLNPSDGTKSRDWYTATESINLKHGSTELATPGHENSPEPILPISKIKDAKNQTGEVKISGIVTSLPNIFFDNRLYIQDETGGIRLKLSYDKWPSLALGTKITVKGKLKTYYSEKELVLIDESAIEPLGIGPLIPFLIKTGEASLWEGALVKISGKITETSGGTFYVDDGSGPAKIFVKEQTGIKLPQKHKGDKAEITGIVNNWSGNFRILPRTSEDIIITPQNSTEDIKVLPISEAKKQPKGTKVKVKGIVSVEPGVLSKSYFYIQDENSGIQIYSYFKNFPYLKLGMLIEVTGEISEIFGEKRIKISGSASGGMDPKDIIILEQRPPPVPQKIKIKDILNYEGMLVKIRGKVVKTSGNTFYISDGTGEIKIVIQKLTGIKKPRLHKGDIVEIIGIVSKAKTGYRILPRYQSDFKLVSLQAKAKKPTKIKGASTSKTEEANLNEPKVVFEARKDKSGSILGLLGWFLVVGSLGSIVWFRRIQLKERV